MLYDWQPALRYLTIVGLEPYSPQPSHQQWQKIYTLLLLAANWALTFYRIYHREEMNELFVSVFVSILVFVSQSVVLTACLLEAIFTYSARFCYLRQLQHIATLFRQRLHTPLCHWDFCEFHRRKYICYLLISYGSMCISIFGITTHHYYGNFCYAIISITLLRLRALQAIIYMDCLSCLVRTLNMKLRALVSAKVAKERGCLDVNYRVLESFEYLLGAKQLYNELHKLSQCFNDAFGISLSALFTVFFLDITVNGYWIFLTLLKLYTYAFYYMTVATVIPLLAILTFLCYAGKRCKEEGRLTAVLVQRLLNSDGRDANCKAYNALLMEFSVQLVQDPIVIRSSGLLAIDFGLLKQMFVSIVTYLVILMQFRSSDENEEA